MKATPSFIHADDDNIIVVVFNFVLFFHLPFPGLIPVCDEIGAGDSGHQACAIQS